MQYTELAEGVLYVFFFHSTVVQFRMPNEFYIFQFTHELTTNQNHSKWCEWEFLVKDVKKHMNILLFEYEMWKHKTSTIHFVSQNEAHFVL